MKTQYGESYRTDTKYLLAATRTCLLPIGLKVQQQFYTLTFLTFLSQGQATTKDKDVPKPTTDLSEDLFKVHDFDVKIDLQVPNAGEWTSRRLASPTPPTCLFSFTNQCRGLTLYVPPPPSAEAKSLSVSSNALPVKDGAPRRSLNLEDYKKRRGLI